MNYKLTIYISMSLCIFKSDIFQIVVIKSDCFILLYFLEVYAVLFVYLVGIQCVLKRKRKVLPIKNKHRGKLKKTRHKSQDPHIRHKWISIWSPLMI